MPLQFAGGNVVMTKERDEENAVKWCAFDLALAEAWAEFADLAPEALQDLIGAAAR